MPNADNFQPGDKSFNNDKSDTLAKNSSAANNEKANEEKTPSVKENGGLALTQIFLEYLRGLGPFPKKLHILFPHKDYYKNEVPFVKHTIVRFMELNPSWNVSIYDDAGMDFLIERAADDEIISVEEKNILLGSDGNPPAHPVERTDLARMLIMWYHGGVSSHKG
ncbi:hypothetical protein ACHAXR_002525 [Thalassiosira sp. AJA248-18]